MKRCTKCNKNKVAAKESWCKKCTSDYLKYYRSEHVEKIKMLMKKWNQEHREENRKRKYDFVCTFIGKMREMNRLAKRRAIKGKIPFELTAKFLEKLWKKQNGKCALTGLSMILPSVRNNGKAQAFSPSLDRIVPKLGYTRKNVRLLCYVVNCGLNEYGDDVFDKIAKAYVYGIMPTIKTEDRIALNQKQEWDNRYRESKLGTITALYNGCKKRAKKSELEFAISKDFISQLLESKKCSITNIPIMYELNANGVNAFRPSLDRIDSSKGYTNDNIRLVCIAVNYCLNEFGISVFDKICRAYLENNEGNN